MWRMILIALVALSGFWLGKTPEKRPQKIFAHVHQEKEFPVSEHKSFAVVIYACNQALWCERALRSVFEQEYDHYRVIFVDDASVDGTAEKARQFIIDNNQDEKVILICNETRMGPVASLYRAIDSCLNREIILPFDAKDWLCSPFVFQRLNTAYQNPDVWISLGQTIEYPSYEISETIQPSFYAALFKQIRLQDLFQNGRFAVHPDAYLRPIADLAGGRVQKWPEPTAFCNRASPAYPLERISEVAAYAPLPAFPNARSQTTAEILIFSSDRPLQLYACLESLQRYVTGFENVTVLYRASGDAFAAGYEKVKQAFPSMYFVAQGDLKADMERVVWNSPSQYILFGIDDLIVKDFVDLKFCMDQMEKTGAYGFYLRLGCHIDRHQPSQSLSRGIYAWDFERGECDWEMVHSLDLTLFKKESLKEPLARLKAKQIDDLASAWAKERFPEHAIGLYFEHSKLVRIPNDLSTEDWLAKFHQGLKIDIEPLYKVENTSVELDYIPELIPR